MIRLVAALMAAAGGAGGRPNGRRSRRWSRSTGGRSRSHPGGRPAGDRDRWSDPREPGVADAGRSSGRAARAARSLRPVRRGDAKPRRELFGRRYDPPAPSLRARARRRRRPDPAAARRGRCATARAATMRKRSAPIRSAITVTSVVPEGVDYTEPKDIAPPLSLPRPGWPIAAGFCSARSPPRSPWGCSSGGAGAGGPRRCGRSRPTSWRSPSSIACSRRARRMRDRSMRSTCACRPFFAAISVGASGCGR